MLSQRLLKCRDQNQLPQLNEKGKLPLSLATVFSLLPVLFPLRMQTFVKSTKLSKKAFSVKDPSKLFLKLLWTYYVFKEGLVTLSW